MNGREGEPIKMFAGGRFYPSTPNRRRSGWR
ncbi:MAG: hypothetical protein ACI9CA_001661, partial [Natronomonas sp.]